MSDKICSYAKVYGPGRHNWAGAPGRSSCLACGSNHTPTNFYEARLLLSGKDRVKLDRNTYLERRSDKAIAVILHATDIVTFTPTYTELNSGGWHTMTTRSRMDDYIPMRVFADGKRGWSLVPVAEIDCWCSDSRSLRSGDGIIVKGEPRVGYRAEFTGEYEDDKPVYMFGPCQHCNATGRRTGHDYASDGYVYYDGIRIKPDGTKLMAKQPHRPKRLHEPIVTVSGWTGDRIGFGRRYSYR